MSLPNGQTVDGFRTSAEILIVGDGTNHPGKTAPALNEVELFCLSCLVGCERAGDARRIPCWVQTRNGRGGADQSRPELGLRVLPMSCQVCAFELVRVNREDSIGFLREPFASSRRLENDQQRDRQQNQHRKRGEIKLPQFLFVDLARELSQFCLML